MTFSSTRIKRNKKCHTRLFMRYILPKQPPIRVFLHNTCTVTIDIYKLVVDHIVAATCSPLQWEVTRLRTCACINKHTCKTLCLRKGVSDTMSLFFVCRRSIEDPSFNWHIIPQVSVHSACVRRTWTDCVRKYVSRVTVTVNDVSKKIAFTQYTYVAIFFITFLGA